MRIALDIGHAEGTGACGNGYEEHELCARLGDALAPLLRDAGHHTKIFDYPDLSNSADLNQSVRDMNSWGADLVISLHADASDNSAAQGAHVCYYSGVGRDIASYVAETLCQLLPGRAKHVDKRTNLYVLKATRAISILCECGFITNAEDAAILANKPELVAEAIAEGIKNYYG